MTKRTYWLTDGAGRWAQVEGADVRDWWAQHGWADAGEPLDDERVLLRHPEHGGTALFPTPSVQTWLDRGWEHAGPPAPDGVEVPEPVAEPTEPVQAAVEAPAPDADQPPAKRTTAKVSTSNQKEK